MRSDQISAAGIIAENVVLALERLDSDSLATLTRGAAIAGLMRELVAVMPTRFNGVLTAACNRYLATLPDQGWAGPRVETVSMVDGSVTMRSD
ncbi:MULTISPECIES: hypothetical protein [unclassified Methylobacterium]|uniref:hypothetical protein n=1 Tax=unclassified Methylobacterium TaxID=2615210 RepID=UPI001FB873CF|nr:MULTISPECIES: hypothetical protein [unclassified Methylobacterium]MCJ2093963.1 hypothetical protein [Methylobacterium sp. J-072]MCJ2142407.1 hypothetical protein [Methylobacterium sp. E-066]